MLDPVVHFLEDCHDTGPLCPTPVVLRASGSQRLTQFGEDMEKRVRNLTTKFMDAVIGDIFLLRHLLADLHVVEGNNKHCWLKLNMFDGAILDRGAILA